MIRNKTVLEMERNGKLYQFFCENESPLGEAFDVLSAFRFEVYKKMKADVETAPKQELCEEQSCEKAAC